MEESRVLAFRALRPPCVELSQITLQHKAKKASGQQVIAALKKAYSTLEQAVKTPNALDAKLADYIFFPLSHVFRDVKELPARAVEVALQCLRILILEGWKAQIPEQMSKQLLILLCFIAGGSPEGPEGIKVKSVQEELGVAAFDCLAALLSVSGTAGLSDPDGSISADNIPILGHSITVLLDGILDGTTNVRRSALSALGSLIEGVHDVEALRSVFPGTVSAITKVVSSKGIARPSYEVTVNGIQVLKAILTKAVADGPGYDRSTEEKAPTQGLATVKLSDNNWVEATAGQVRMALANIIPLRYHEKAKVREALSQLCIAVIQRCRISLNQAIPMLIETLVVLSTETPDRMNASFDDTEVVFAADATLLDMLSNSLHDWIIALPRVMQSNDDDRKVRIIDQISTAFRILESQRRNLDLLNDIMAANLQSSVAIATQANQSTKVTSVAEDSLAVNQTLQSNGKISVTREFEPILFQASGAKSSTVGLQRLAHQLQHLPLPGKLQQGLVSTLRATSGDEQLASLWISLQILSSSTSSNDITNEYLDLPIVSDAQEPLLDEIYAFSVEILSTSTFEDVDRWKLQSLCLEVIALQARHQKIDFRPELVDTLYPILERLGSTNSALQSHALTCLSIVSVSCQYVSPAALITENADYLVNAISLKLNTFDISPQAPQVLVMMITLCGSSLIPYLDDLIESIFSILACYHGYPKLVESLFSVLHAVVDQAASANDKTIDYRPDGIRKPFYPHSKPIGKDLTSRLRSNGDTQAPLDPGDPSDQAPDPEDTPSSAPPDTTTTSPKPSKTTSLIHAITTATPPHLSSPSPTLRSNILSLLSVSLPILASDADTILPLAATLFPLISTRLFFPLTFSTTTKTTRNGHHLSPATSPPSQQQQHRQGAPYHETLAAATALRTLCTCSGDFLSSRIQDPIWFNQLRRLYTWAEDGMKEERKMMGIGLRRRRSLSTPSLTTTTTTKNSKSIKGGMRWRVWDGVVALILGLVVDVGFNEDEGKESGVWEMLWPWIVRLRSRSDGWEGGEGRGRGGGGEARVSRDGDGDVHVDDDDAMTEERRKEVREVLEMMNPELYQLTKEEKGRGGG